MAYGVILTVACVLLAVRYAFVVRASVRSRCIVGGMAVASFLVPWRIAAIVGQLAISLYVLLYLKAFPPGDEKRGGGEVNLPPP
jgi:hypothetical protein